MSTNIILLFSLAMDGTYTVLKISFTTRLYAQGKDTGPDIFHFVVFLGKGIGGRFSINYFFGVYLEMS